MNNSFKGTSKNQDFFVNARKPRAQNRSVLRIHEDSSTASTPESRKKNIFRGALRSITAVLTIAAAFLLPLSSSQASGLMQPVNSTGPALELSEHHVDVTIENGFATTQVDQVFKNPTGSDLEAMYRFPVPDKAAVVEFTVWIDGQPVIGEVFEKEEARQLYQQEKAAGREAGLTEKNKHYNFEVRVTPVRANQDTRLRLVYMQPIAIDTGIGRYVYPLEDGGTDELAKSFWTGDTTVHEAFSFNMNLRSGYKIVDTRVPAHHSFSVSNTDAHQWHINFQNGVGSVASEREEEQSALQLQGEASTGPAASLDQDIVVYWRLDENTPARVDLVTHKPAGSTKGTFMLTLTPGDDLQPITEGQDWVFVLDMSGSMAGKYHTLVDGVQRALGTLNSDDRFRIVQFNQDGREMTKGWIPATPDAINRWSDRLAKNNPEGGTNLYAGAKTGLDLLDTDRTSAIVLVTDGEANVGVTEKKRFLELMKKYDVRLFTAVMGNGTNRPLLNAMAEVSNGFAVSVSNSDDIVGKLMGFTSKTTHQAFHDIALSIEGVRTAELTPEVTRTLYRGEQLMVLGHYFGGGEATVTLSGKVSGEEKRYHTRFDFPAISEGYPELERLWAFAKVTHLQELSDYLGDDAEYKGAMVDIAVNHGIVTDHTSMVVMREEQFASRGIERKNRDRRAIETQAVKQRNAQPVSNTRADARQPVFSGSSATYSSGGGAFGPELAVLALLLLSVLFRNQVINHRG